MIDRLLEHKILSHLEQSRKICLLFGARQVGKTTLLKSVVKNLHQPVLWINADQVTYHDALSSCDLAKIKEVIGNYRLVIIDECQNIPEIGMNLKIIYDEMPGVKVIATGSSSPALADKTREPLTGRALTYKLYPVSIQELLQTDTVFDIKTGLSRYLVYGMYPEILTIQGAQNKTMHLRELVSSYLYKDVLKLSNIKHSDKIHKLLQLLAYQIGSLVSVHELSNTLGISHETVSSYIDLLEKGFIIQRLSGLSKNPRKEVSKMDKIYFTDVGIRNALIEDFNPIDIRPDIGNLWENFLFIERQKYCHYNNIHGKTWFWRTYSGAELDLIEQRDGKLFGFELKWKDRKRKPPEKWIRGYNNASFEVINRENFIQFVSGSV
jgi:uncharacterized protein